MAAVLVAVAGGMVGLAFASVPLYRLFCQVTGYGGTPRVAVGADAGAALDREITVRFDATVNSALPWRFRPVQREMRVRLGEPALAFFAAANVSDAPVVGTATFNVTPAKAARFFVKTQCFCFTEQRLAAGEEASMPVSFFVDPEILADANARDVDTITLSYTFFRADADGDAIPAPDAAAGRPADPPTPSPRASDRDGQPAFPGKAYSWLARR